MKIGDKRHLRMGKTYEELFGIEKSKEMKRNLRNINLNKKITEKQKQILRDLKKGKTHIELYGKDMAEKMRKINSEKHKGKTPFNKGKTNIELYGAERARKIKEKAIRSKIGIKSKRKGKSLEREYGKTRAENIRKKIQESHRGYKTSNKTKQKLREITIKNIERNFGSAVPFHGKNEDCILDEIEEKYNIELERQHRVCGYFLDGYDKKNNIVYEIDEIRHFKSVEKKEYTEKHLIRKNNIINHLKCEWISIKD